MFMEKHPKRQTDQAPEQPVGRPVAYLNGYFNYMRYNPATQKALEIETIELPQGEDRPL